MSQIDVRLNLVLHKNQRQINESLAKNKVVKAGKRFGKTHWLLYALLRKCMKPDQNIWYVAPTYSQAKSIAWDHLRWLVPKEVIRRKVENELYIELINGSMLRLKGSDNEDSLRGTKIHGLGMDEAAYQARHIWDAILRGQLLGNDAEGGTGFAYFISSPNRKGRSWFTEFHAEAAKKQLAGDKDWAAFYYTIFDNPTIPRSEIEKIRDGVPEETWNVEYMALESEFSGPLYGEFSYAENTGIYEGQDALFLVRGIDWGISHPTVCLWLHVDLKNKMVYVSDEFVRSGLVIQESCEMIKKMTGDRPVEWTVIDPSTSKRNSQTFRTDKDEFQRWGVPCLPGDNRDRGYDIVRMFLKKRMLKIHPKCKTLIYEMRNVQKDDKEGEDCLDALRYAMVRIHDQMFGGNVIYEEGITPRLDWTHKRECSFEDPQMFPAVKKNRDSWILEEIDDGQ